MFIGSRTWPPLHLDAVVAMRSESRTGPRAMAAVIFSFCFFEMLVFVLRAADRHTLAPNEARESTRMRMRAFARTAAMPNDRVSATVALYSGTTVATVHYPTP